MDKSLDNKRKYISQDGEEYLNLASKTVDINKIKINGYVKVNQDCRGRLDKFVTTNISKDYNSIDIIMYANHIFNPFSIDEGDILYTPISPELLPSKDGEIAQKTEDSVGPYELNDFFLYYVIKYNFTPEKILELAKTAFENKYTNDELRERLKLFYKRFFNSQFKRSCSPDGPKVGSISLSPRSDWKMPSDAIVNMWINSI